MNANTALVAVVAIVIIGAIIIVAMIKDYDVTWIAAIIGTLTTVISGALGLKSGKKKTLDNLKKLTKG